MKALSPAGAAPERAHDADLRRGRAGWGIAVLALLLAAGSCAPPPPAVSPTPPPAPTPAPAPVTPPPVEIPPIRRGEPSITVGLAWDLDSLVVRPAGDADLFVGEEEVEGDPQSVRVARNHGEVRVSYRGLHGQTVHRALAPAETLSIEARGGSGIVWNGKTWRGTLKAFVNPRGTLTLATRLPLEQYLLGVVPYEIGQLGDSLIEAGRAQAVAARTYTLFYVGRRAAEGFDVYGTVEDQVYGSIEGEKLFATRCVIGTSGLVALYQGQPIRANYHSTCGGMLAEVWEGWPVDPLPYLVSGADRAEADTAIRPRGPDVDFCASSPVYRWREEWTAAEFLSDLRTYGPAWSVPMPAGGPGELVDVRVASRSASGRVWRLEVVTTGGTIVIPGYSLRQVLRRGGHPESILRSNLFKIAVRRDHDGGRVRSVVASGAGSGHGVGLCQTGALGMARAGYRGEEILRHYYRGVTLDRLY